MWRLSRKIGKTAQKLEKRFDCRDRRRCRASDEYKIYWQWQQMKTELNGS